MKERPIIFSAPMVRAILEGRKTQTRRVVKDTGFYCIEAARYGPEDASRELAALATQCPYGKPGDRLWVKETWQVCPKDQCIPGEFVKTSRWNKEWRVAYRATVPSETHPEHPEWLTSRITNRLYE